MYLLGRPYALREEALARCGDMSRSLGGPVWSYKVISEDNPKAVLVGT